jgi:hypothetical protein
MSDALLTHDIVLSYLLSHGLFKTAETMQIEISSSQGNGLSSDLNDLDIQTKIVSYNPCENDPHGSTNMPIYQTATFKQPGK